MEQGPTDSEPKTPNTNHNTKRKQHTPSKKQTNNTTTNAVAKRGETS